MIMKYNKKFHKSDLLLQYYYNEDVLIYIVIYLKKNIIAIANLLNN